MSPETLKKEIERIEKEGNALLEEDRQLAAQSNAIAERRNQVGVAVVGLQAEMRICQRFLQEETGEAPPAPTPIMRRRGKNRGESQPPLVEPTPVEPDELPAQEAL